MRVQLIYSAGCPHVDAARENLQRAVADCGFSVRVEEFDTTVPTVPRHLRDYGSPTILVNGKDVAGATGPTGPSCRLYPGPQGVPSVDGIRAALTAASGPRVFGGTT